MSAELAVYTILKNDAPVAALVGTRIFPSLAPQNAANPLIVYQRISADRITSLDGPSGLSWARVQVDCYAETYAGAKTLSAAIRVALEGYRGTVGGVRVGGISLETDRDLYENDPEPGLFRVTHDFTVIHDE